MYEIEYRDGTTWIKEGFHTMGGFVPYRYDGRADAAQAIRAMRPGCETRVVKAKTVVGEK